MDTQLINTMLDNPRATYAVRKQDTARIGGIESIIDIIVDGQVIETRKFELDTTGINSFDATLYEITRIDIERKYGHKH